MHVCICGCYVYQVERRAYSLAGELVEATLTLWCREHSGEMNIEDKNWFILLW